MSNRKPSVGSLVGKLTSTGLKSSLDVSAYERPLKLSSSTSALDALHAASSGVRSLATGSDARLSPIQFGKPSGGTSSSTAGGISAHSIVSQAVSGGVASAFSGGLGGISGLGGLISGIASLFGGSSKPAPPPLTLFSMPDSIQVTSSVGQGSARTSAPIYTSSNVTAHTQSAVPASTVDSGAIAQAVKQALLTSNSLGDVIAEL